MREEIRFPDEEPEVGNMTLHCPSCSAELPVLMEAQRKIEHADDFQAQVERLTQERDDAHRQIAVLVEAGVTDYSKITGTNRVDCHFCNGVWRADETAKHKSNCPLIDIPAASKEIGANLERAEKLAEWIPILEAAQRQDIKWKKPMPADIDPGDNSVYVWALKAQEELGELSAALLGDLIGKDGRGDTLEECYQLIAVLLRITGALREMEGKR